MHSTIIERTVFSGGEVYIVRDAVCHSVDVLPMLITELCPNIGVETVLESILSLNNLPLQVLSQWRTSMFSWLSKIVLPHSYALVGLGGRTAGFPHLLILRTEVIQRREEMNKEGECVRNSVKHLKLNTVLIFSQVLLSTWLACLYVVFAYCKGFMCFVCVCVCVHTARALDQWIGRWIIDPQLSQRGERANQKLSQSQSHKHKIFRLASKHTACLRCIRSEWNVRTLGI